MPLIETVTYPDCTNPDEVKEACDYIRFLNRSTGKVRTGMGAGRQDVNVSCKGGTRVEIKGVAHTKWIPELTHVECFRQWALLMVRDELRKRVANPENWKINYKIIGNEIDFENTVIGHAVKNNHKLVAVNLPHFKGLLSHFTQPGKTFASEFSDRLKVIACLEKPNIATSEDLIPILNKPEIESLVILLNAGNNDAQLLFWGPEPDIKTALDTIEERAKMAFDGVPNETRKSFEDGTTIFERVLPGADRMYPDTDTAPIPLNSEHIEELGRNLPEDINDRINKMIKWQIPEDTFSYLLSKNFFPLIEKIITELNLNPRFVGTFIGHYLKFVEGHFVQGKEFEYSMLFDLFYFLKSQELNVVLAKKMLPILYEHPKMDFDSILTSIKFKKQSTQEIISRIPFLVQKFSETARSYSDINKRNWVTGQLRPMAIGNIDLSILASEIYK